ncbi:hypothetical protein Y032_0010g1007 [Ancylostoma ceylanicum]|uniref:SCP domain-containing protein n=1 Tax=Ancylostoma ceylanicum TaxID=53326 RepID=A0A016VGP0_9BILA|nr:hypothetical protein Y032_0010g1007 [Ancylostoma ceylanicum]
MFILLLVREFDFSPISTSLCFSITFPLKLLLWVNEASSQFPKRHRRAGCSNDPTDAFRKTVLEAHNKIRKDIVGNNVVQEDETKLPGSKNLFKIPIKRLLSQCVRLVLVRAL